MNHENVQREIERSDERRRYALLQAAATILGVVNEVSTPDASIITTTVTIAEGILAEIESREEA